MLKRSCSVPGCDRPHAARELCTMHWKREHGKPTRWPHDCAGCGKRVMKSYQKLRGDRRPTCSDLCRAWLQHGPLSCTVPVSHPSRFVLRLHPARPTAPPKPLVQIECEWCGTKLMQNDSQQRYCTRECKIRGAKARRKGRESDGRVYSWTHVMRVLVLLDGRCAYCDVKLDGPPEPDHVVPLSRGGSNGNANILPACSACNSDKRDLLLHEWAIDRTRRGKPPVRTEINRFDLAFRHLLPDAITSAAA